MSSQTILFYLWHYFFIAPHTTTIMARKDKLGKQMPGESMSQGIRRICSASSRVFLIENIPLTLVQNARRSLNIPASEEMWCLIDFTVVQSATDACVIASSGVYVKNMWHSPWFLPWREVARSTALDFEPGFVNDFWHLRHPDGDRLIGKHYAHSFEQDELLTRLYRAVQSHDWAAEPVPHRDGGPASFRKTGDNRRSYTGRQNKTHETRSEDLTSGAAGTLPKTELLEKVATSLEVFAAGLGLITGAVSAAASLIPEPPPTDPNNGMVRCDLCGGQGVKRVTIYENGGSRLKESNCTRCGGKGWTKG